ncbi:MAG: AsmA-like C-terminal region-containing protein [Planctomycetota bacterium]
MKNSASSSRPRYSLRRRLFKIFCWLFLLFLISLGGLYYWITRYLLESGHIRAFISQKLHETLNGKVILEEVNWVSGTFFYEGISFRNASIQHSLDMEESPLISIPELDVFFKIQWWKIFSNPIALTKIILKKPQVAIQYKQSNWNILDIYNFTPSPPASVNEEAPVLPDIEIQDANILYRDQTLFNGMIKAHIEKATLDAKGYHLQIKIDGEHLPPINIELSGQIEFYNAKEKKLNLLLKTPEIPLHSRWMDVLSKQLPLEEIREKLKTYDPQGKISLEIQLEVDDQKASVLRYGFQCHLKEFQAKTYPLEFSFHQFEGKIIKTLDSDRIILKECHGELEEGRITVEGEMDRLDPSANLTLNVELQHFRWNDSLIQKLPAQIQEMLKECEIQGEVTTGCSLSRTQEKGLAVGPIWLTLKNGFFRHQKVHFPIEHIEGKIRFEENQIRILEAEPLSLETLEGKVQIWGKLDHLQETPEFEAFAKVKQGTTTEGLYKTVPPKAQEILDLIRATGRADVDARVWGKLSGKIEDIHWYAEGRIENAQLFPSVFPIKLYGVSGRVIVTPEGVDLLDGSGYDTPEKKGKPNLKLLYGRIAPLSQSEVNLDIRAEEVQITKEIYFAVRNAKTKNDTGKILDRYLPWGTVNVNVKIHAPPGEDTGSDVSILIDSVDTQINMQPFPNSGRIPFHKVKGQVEILPEGVFLKNLSGELYYGGFVSVNGAFLEEKDQLHLDIIGKTVGLHQTLKNALEPDAQEAWEMLQPRGSIDLEATLSQSKGGEPEIELKIKPDSCWVNYQEIPYELVLQNQGYVWVDSKKIQIENVRGFHGKSILSIQGVLDRTSDKKSPGAIDLHLTSEKLLVNEDLKKCLPKNIQTIQDFLEVDGEIQLDCYVKRARKSSEIQHLIKIQAVDVSVVYKNFPYPIEKVTGEILFDSQKQFIQLIGVTGFHHSASFAIQGWIELTKTDKQFSISLEAKQVRVDKELKKALHPKHHPVWEMFDPFGLIDVSATLSKSLVEPLNTRMQITVKEGEITYKEFRIPVKKLAGVIDIQNERLVIQKLTGRSKNAQISFSGSIEDYLTSSFLELHSEFSDIPLNEELGTYLPKDFQDIWKDLNPRGISKGNGTLTVLTNSEGKYHITYGGSLTLEKGALKAGFQFREVQGKLDFQGKFFEQKHIFKGKLDLQTLSISELFKRDLQMKNATADLLIQSDYLLMQKLKASLHEGTLSGEVLLNNTAIHPYMMNFQVRGTDLGLLAAEVTPPASKEEETASLEGKIDAGIEVQGNSGTLESMVGEGWIELHQAKLWRLPLFLSIFDVLNLADGSPFESGNIEFRIRDKLVNISKMRFASTPLTLKGYGVIDFELDLDFYFNTSIAPSLFPKIPMLTDTWHELKGNFVLLHVYGSYDDLTTSLSTFRAVREAFGGDQKPDLSEIKRKKQARGHEKQK